MAITQRQLRIFWQSSLVTAILYSVVCLTWGTTWLGIKVAVDSIPPLTASGARFVIAFPFFLIICLLARAPVFFPKNRRVFFVLLTVFYFSAPYYFISYGEQYVSSGLTSLLFSTMPIFSIIFSALLLNEKIKINQIIGITIGFGCLVVILKSEGLIFTHKGLTGVLAILSAAMMHGFLYVFSKKNASDINVFTFNTLPVGLAGFLLCGAGLVVEKPDLSAASQASWVALLYLGVVASAGGFIVYFYLLKRMSPIILSFIFIIFPVVAVGIGALYENKTVTPEFFIFSSLMLIGFGLTKLPIDTLKRRLENMYGTERSAKPVYRR